MPAGRVVVNSPAPQGSIGASTNLFPAMTLGCGAMGGNITSDNISPLHLVNLKRVAYESRPARGEAVVPAKPPVSVATPVAVAAHCACETTPASVAAVTEGAAFERVAAARAVERFLARRAAEPAVLKPSTAETKPPAASTPVALKPKPLPVAFVGEVEIRAAIRRKEKILIGPKTIITPLARDLAAEHDVLTRE